MHHTFWIISFSPIAQLQSNFSNATCFEELTKYNEFSCLWNALDACFKNSTPWKCAYT